MTSTAMNKPLVSVVTAHVKRPILQVIREKCIDCSGGSLAEVRRCPVTGCALHPYRMARDPEKNRPVWADFPEGTAV
jgi:hypothetical protein